MEHIVFVGEKEAEEEIIKYAEQYGYGRVIQMVQEAWYNKSIQQGFSEGTASHICGTVCVRCGTDKRTGKPYDKNLKLIKVRDLLNEK